MTRPPRWNRSRKKSVSRLNIRRRRRGFPGRVALGRLERTTDPLRRADACDHHLGQRPQDRRTGHRHAGVPQLRSRGYPRSARRPGHIALEVHDNDAMFGETRWGKGAQCRWRNIRIRELNTETEERLMIRALRPASAARSGLPPSPENPGWCIRRRTSFWRHRTGPSTARRSSSTATGSCGRFDVAGGEPTEVPLSGIPDLNNDHVLAPDGTGIFLSANDGHIYRALLDGGPAKRITGDDGAFHFLHGVSPDGQELAYVGIEAGDFTRPGRLMTIPASGGATPPCVGVTATATGPSTPRTANGCTSTRSPSPATRPRPARPHPSRPGRSANGTNNHTSERLLERNRRLVPASVPRRPPGQLHPFPQRHGGPPRGPAGRRRACLDRRLGNAAAHMAALRRARDAERQQLVARFRPVRVRGVPAQPTPTHKGLST